MSSEKSYWFQYYILKAMHSSKLLMTISQLLYTAKWLQLTYSQVNFIKYKKLESWENIKAKFFNIHETGILSKGTTYSVFHNWTKIYRNILRRKTGLKPAIDYKKRTNWW